MTATMNDDYMPGRSPINELTGGVVEQTGRGGSSTVAQQRAVAAVKAHQPYQEGRAARRGGWWSNNGASTLRWTTAVKCRPRDTWLAKNARSAPMMH